MDSYDYNLILQNLKIDIDSVYIYLNIDNALSEIKDISMKLKDESIWSDHELFGNLSQKKNSLERKISNFITIKNNFNAISELIKEIQYEEILEFIPDLLKMKQELQEIKILQNFSHETDICDAFIEINAGAGGTDSQDWAEMMVRMYSMWAGINKFTWEIIDCLEGEEAGIKSIAIKVCGEYTYGWLKNEIGIHRLVRISPFNSNAKRQTSFASVFAYPIVNDKIEINIVESDLRIDTYRSSGAGGQHVNKTESAVRITHIPTNTVVACQTQRSQIQNRAEAMRMLKSKLYEQEMRKKLAVKDKINDSKMDISFGSQIRNYVLHPYQLVKDVRTGWETGNTRAFLDGNIKDCMESVLMFKNK